MPSRSSEAHRAGSSQSSFRMSVRGAVGRQPPCGPGRTHGRRIHELVRVFRGERGHCESRVVQGATYVGILVEELPVLLAERVTVTRMRELDRAVARASFSI